MLPMRPDDIVLSAYLDGEIPSKLLPNVEQAIAADPEARQRLAELRALRERLVGDEAPDVDELMTESWWVIRRRLAVGRVRTVKAVRGRQVRLPLPVFAAAAAVFLAVVGVLIWSVIPEQPMAAPDYLAQGQDVDVTIRVDDAEMEQVLQWLVDQNMLGEISIQLPEQEWQIVGEPVLVRPSVIPGGIRE
jgi:hypothetical protein